MRTFLASMVCVGGFALAAPVHAAAAKDDVTEAASAKPAVAVQQVALPLPGIRDEAAMVLVGTALIGLGAAVRRAA